MFERIKRNKSVAIAVMFLFVGVISGLIISSNFGWIPFGFASRARTVALGSEEDVSAGLLALQNTSKAFIAVSKMVNPTVVTIEGEQKPKTLKKEWKNSPFDDDFFNRFFHFEVPDVSRPVLGSGVIVNPDGYIITNNHVVNGIDNLKVTTLSGKEYEAKIIGQDPKTDLAIIKIDEKDLPVIKFGDSDKLEVGEWVLAIGNPFGQSHTVTAGIVSAKNRSGVIDFNNFEDFIQTDAAINPGNSGGALVNLRGELVGINTAIESQTGINMGVGFAIPINMAKKVMESLLSRGKVSRGYLGVYIGNINNNMAEKFGLETPQGAIVQEVTKGTPAEKAGIEAGDIIIEFEGEQIKDSSQLRNSVAGQDPGTVVHLKGLRNGKKLDFSVKLAERPKDEQLESEVEEAPEKAGSQYEERIGIEVKETKSGVVIVSVKQGDIAAKEGLRGNDIIKEINRTPIGSLADYEKAMKRVKSNDIVLFRIKRGDHFLFVALRIPKD